MIPVCAVDYSMTCPCLIFVDPVTCDFNTSNVYYLTSDKRLVGQKGNLEGTLHLPYSSPEERFSNIATWAFQKVQFHQPYHVYIEGYSMGSRGKVFHIGENTGLLKQVLYRAQYAFTTIPPTVVKKVATGKGNATKDKMYEAFLKETGQDIKQVLSPKRKLGSPEADIVDAYFIAKTGLTPQK